MTEAVAIYSEADLAREFEHMSTVLSDMSRDYIENDWQERIKSMKRIQAVIASGGTAFDNFLPLMLKFMMPLSVQLSDLRSAIVREAYNTLVQAAEACRDSFEQCAERIADTLFKLLNSGTKVLADAGHMSFTAILENVITFRLIPKIVDNIRSKNAFVRSKSAFYLAYMLEHYPKQVFEAGESARGHIYEMMEQGILCAIHDASSEARAAGRNCFISYRTMFTERADGLYYRLDPAAQKAVGEMIGGPPSRHAKTLQAPVTKKVPSRESPQPVRPGSDETTTPKRPSSSKQSPITSTKATTPSRSLVSSTLPERLPEKWPEKPEKPMEVPVARPPAKPYFKPRPQQPHSESHEAGMKYDSTGDTGSSASVLKPPADPPRPIAMDTTPPQPDEDAVEELPVPKMKTKSKEIGPSEKLDFIIEKTYHENWSTRCNSFTRLTSTLSSEPNLEGLFITPGLWEKLINTHIEHLSDSHFKVIAGCLASLQRLIELLPEKVSYELEKLMPGLLGCLGDGKESVYQSACTVLELIIDLYMADDLMKLVLKSAGAEVKPKMKVKLLEVMGILGETSEGYFNIPGNIKLFLRKLIALSRDGLMVKAVLQAGFRAVTAVRDKNTAAVLAVMNELPAEEQMVLRRLSNEVPRVIEEAVKTEPAEPVMRQKNPRPAESPIFDLFTSVLESCKGTGVGKVEALTKLQKLIDEYLTHPGVWSTLGSEIISTLLLFLTDDALSIRENAISLLLKSYTAQRDKLRSVLNTLLQGVIKAMYVEDRHSLQLAEDAVQSILEQEVSDTWSGLLCKYMDTEDSPALQALIRILTRLVKRAEKPSGSALLAVVMPALAKTLNHTNPDVRKSVVFSLVELHYAFGDGFSSYLAQLSQSQQKLVTIYIQRRQEPYI